MKRDRIQQIIEGLIEDFEAELVTKMEEEKDEKLIEFYRGRVAGAREVLRELKREGVV